MGIKKDKKCKDLNKLVNKFDADDILHCIDEGRIKYFVLNNDIVEPTDFEPQSLLDAIDETEIAKYMEKEYNADFSVEPIKVCVGVMRAYSWRYLSKEDLKKEICEYIDNMII